MRIGIDARAANWYRGTGIGTYTYQLINSLNKIDITNDYTLLSNYNDLDISLSENFNIKNIQIEHCNNFWEDVKKQIPMSNSEFDIYHVPQNGVGLPNSSCNFPFVITLHDTIPLHMPETVSDKYLSLFSSCIDSIIKNCSGIITVSNYSKNDIIKDFGFPEEKIFVTHLASEEIYKPLDKSLCRNILKKYYSIDNDYILYVGGFSPRKNISGLIESFSKIQNKLPRGMKLIIAGNKGISYNIYKSLSEKLGISDSVIFPGFIDMNLMPYLYSGASILAYPSFYEGFGLPPIEAMACGTPVVASNVTSIPEVVGDSALLCDPYDIDSISKSILQAVLDEDVRRSLIEKGFKKAASLTWNETARNTLNAYNCITKSLI